jgi:hypothetical protein
MAGTERDRIRLEGEATSVIGAVVDFYERHLQDRDGVAVEELRGMKRVVPISLSLSLSLDICLSVYYNAVDL